MFEGYNFVEKGIFYKYDNNLLNKKKISKILKKNI